MSDSIQSAMDSRIERLLQYVNAVADVDLRAEAESLSPAERRAVLLAWLRAQPPEDEEREAPVQRFGEVVEALAADLNRPTSDDLRQLLLAVHELCNRDFRLLGEAASALAAECRRLHDCGIDEGARRQFYIDAFDMMLTRKPERGESEGYAAAAADVVRSTAAEISLFRDLLRLMQRRRPGLWSLLEYVVRQTGVPVTERRAGLLGRWLPPQETTAPTADTLAALDAMLSACTPLPNADWRQGWREWTDARPSSEVHSFCSGLFDTYLSGIPHGYQGTDHEELSAALIRSAVWGMGLARQEDVVGKLREMVDTWAFHAAANPLVAVSAAGALWLHGSSEAIDHLRDLAESAPQPLVAESAEKLVLRGAPPLS